MAACSPDSYTDRLMCTNVLNRRFSVAVVTVALVLMPLTAGALWGETGRVHSQVQAEEAGPSAEQTHREAGSHDSKDAAEQSHDTTHDVDHMDPGMSAARRLSVSAPPEWFKPVMTSFAVLFILAVTLGSVAVLTKGPEPVDDHGHDEHGHAHHSTVGQGGGHSHSH